jgi:hypothetical protein
MFLAVLLCMLTWNTLFTTFNLEINSLVQKIFLKYH